MSVPTMAFRWCLVIVAMWGCFAKTASACNIPVFRFALERWQTDLIEVVVFHRQPLDEIQLSKVAAIRSTSRNHGGAANLEVITRPIDEIPEEDLQAAWDGLASELQQQTPVVVVRSRASRGRWLSIWEGSLDDLNLNELLTSPARREITQRLLQGDSVVWLVLKSTDEKKNQQVLDMLQAELPQAANKIPIPEGIGLPGSELYAPLPLSITFSVLAIDQNAPEEKFLVQSLQRLHKSAADASMPLVVPIFGRGRALEVIRSDAISPTLVEELSIFLSAACSCQVKDLNPGFDLLLNVPWETELYGDEIPDIAEPLHQQRDDDAPLLLEIPAGQATSQHSVTTPPDTQTPKPSASVSEAKSSRGAVAPRAPLVWLPVVFLGAVLATVVLRQLK